MRIRLSTPKRSVVDSSEQAARKQITVLFCDMADYTSRSNSMDPEDLADEIRVFQTLCTKVADKYHSHIANYLGDGILVLFGYPYANEFDAEHAVRASLEMVEEIQQNNASFEWRNKEPISIRIGIATSLVVVGEKAGKQRDQDELVFGQAPTLAERLQSLAKPNTVITSLRTRRLVGGAFKFKELEEQQWKGFPKPVSAWQLLHESTFQNRNYTSLKRVTTPFVSRSRELSFLTDNYEKSINADSTVVHVTGDAGIGKSRLLRVFEKTLNKQNIHRIRVSCSPYFHSTPLRSVIDEIFRWIEINTDDKLPARQIKVKRALTELHIEDNGACALFYEILSVALPNEIRPLIISAEVKHQRTIDILTQIVLTLSKGRPILLIVEDLHWSDPTTLELLNNLINKSGNHRLFGVFTSRPEFQPDWKQSNSLINLNLNGLDRNESVQLIKSVFGNTPLPKNIETTLVQKSDGIPLYLEECCWHILNQIQDTDRDENHEEDFAVPDTLQDSLNARLDMLGDAKELAQLGAAFGAFFTYSRIEKVAELNGIDADNGMDVLLQASLLSIIFTKDEDRYVFRHTMFQDAAYQSLLRKTRQRYHQQIAELFIKEDPDISNSQPELVAYHYGRTERLDIAVDLWIKAGEVAIRKSAITEAQDHLDHGLAQLTQLADNPVNNARELSLLLNLAVCLTIRSGYFGDRVTRTYKRCIELANDVGNAEQQWSALYGYWRCLICQAEFSNALKISVKLKRLSDSLGDRTLFMTSFGIQAMTRMIAGKFRSAEKYYDNAIKLYDRIEDKNVGIRFGQDPYVTIQGLGAVTLLIRGDEIQSRLEMETSVEISRSIGHPYTIAETLRLAAVYEQIARNTNGLRRFANEAVSLSEKFGFEGLHAASKIFIAFSNVVTYRDPDAIESIRENLNRYKDKYALLFYPYFQGLLAESYLYMQRFQEAFTESNHALLLIEKCGENWMQVPMLHIKAESAALGKLAAENEIGKWYAVAESLAKNQYADLFLHRLLLSRKNFELNNAQQSSNESTCSRKLSDTNNTAEDEPGLSSANQ